MNVSLTPTTFAVVWSSAEGDRNMSSTSISFMLTARLVRSDLRVPMAASGWTDRRWRRFRFRGGPSLESSVSSASSLDSLICSITYERESLVPRSLLLRLPSDLARTLSRGCSESSSASNELSSPEGTMNREIFGFPGPRFGLPGPRFGRPGPRLAPCLSSGRVL
jgi:hypothetical protein